MSIRISKSKIHGKGVFANQSFKKGEIVLRWNSCSRKVSEAEYSKLSEGHKRMVSEGYLYFSPSQFMNHSCNANVKNIEGYDTAVRDISEGEEITCNYLDEDVPFITMNCGCGSSNCRKVLEYKLFS
jgi:SET domain-containing protein